jgi:N-acetylneuraminic acid mutarotase
MRSFTTLLLIIASTLTATAQTWSTIGSTPNTYPGRWSPASFTIGTKVYFGGGYVNGSNAIDFWEFNPADKQWTQKKDIPGSDRTGGIFFSIGGKGYIGLGAKDFNSISATPTPLKDLWEFDPAANTWTKKADLPDSARYECNVMVINNKAYVVGGTTGKWTSAGGYVATNDVWEYNPTNNQWTAKKPFPAQAVIQAMPFTISSKGYMACGSILSAGAFAESKTLYEYNPSSDAWTKKADFAGTERSGGIGFNMGVKGYVGLGKKGFASFFQDIYTYDPTVDKWSTTSMQIPGVGRSYSSVAVASTKVYIGAGWSLSGNSQSYYKDWYLLAFPGVGVSTPSGATSSMTCYPNPITGKLYIDIPSATPGKSYPWTLYDIVGRKVTTGTTATRQPINLSNLTTGKYIIEVDVEGTLARTTIDATEG